MNAGTSDPTSPQPRKRRPGRPRTGTNKRVDFRLTSDQRDVAEALERYAAERYPDQRGAYSLAARDAVVAWYRQSSTHDHAEARAAEADSRVADR